MIGVLKNILRWLVYLPLWQSSSYIAEPTWPGPNPEVVAASLTAVAPAEAHGGSDTTAVERPDATAESIRKVPICILWTQPWAGELGSSVLFHVKRMSSNRISVGYFAYWSTERPWGDNGLTHWVFPAVAIDAFYSHALFVLPGIRQLMYGAGDVEGLRVTYGVTNAGRLEPLAAIANDATHREVSLDLGDLLDDRGRILVYAAWWSHQLGGKGARSVAKAGAWEHCYSGNALRAITPEVSGAFRLGSIQQPRRARPAWRLSATAPS